MGTAGAGEAGAGASPAGAAVTAGHGGAHRAPSVRHRFRETTLAVFATGAMTRGDEEEALLEEERELVAGRSVSLNAQDRALMMLDFLQWYALLWVASRAWPWPFFWTEGTVYAVFANADLTAFTHFHSVFKSSKEGVASTDFSEWGEWEGYWFMAVLAAALAAALPLGYLVWVLRLKARANDFVRHRAAAWRWVLILSQVFYVPVGVNVARLAVCRNDNVEVDPDVECMSSKHVVVAAAAGSVGGLFLLLVPLLLYRSAHRHLLYRSARAHESHLRWKELQYLVGLNDDWATQQMHVTSPFRRAHAHHRAVAAVEKLLLLAVNTFIRDNDGLQGVLYFTSAVLFGVWFIARPVYRNLRTQLMLVALRLMLMYFGVFAMFKATGMRNALMIDSALLVWLIIGSTLFGAMYLAVAGVAAWRWRTGRRTWTTEPRDAQVLSQAPWMRTVRAAHELMYRASFVARAMVPVHRMDNAMRRLRVYLDEAKEAGDLVMEWTIVETMEDLAATLKLYRPHSLYPNELLETHMPGFASRVRQRNYERLLLRPRTRRILTKLLALRVFQVHGARARDRAAAGAAGATVGPATVGLMAPGGEFSGDPGAFLETRVATDARAEDLDEMLDHLESHQLPPWSVQALAEQLMRDTVEALQPPRALEQLQVVRHQWRRLIRRWEVTFQEVHGHPPSLKDKREIKPWLQHHKRVTEALKEAFGEW